MTSPTQRSLALLRAEGYIAQVVERFNPYAKVRVDLLGVIDIVAVSEAREEILGVQATSGDHHSHRIEKALTQPGLRGWLAGGGHFEVWSWSKRGPRGKRKLWSVRREAIVLLNGTLRTASVCLPAGDERGSTGPVPHADAEGAPSVVEGAR